MESASYFLVQSVWGGGLCKFLGQLHLVLIPSGTNCVTTPLDDDVFTTVSGNTYPAEMVLKNTNISPNEVNYLDLNITIYAIQGKYVYKSSYGKRDDFNFKIYELS